MTDPQEQPTTPIHKVPSSDAGKAVAWKDGEGKHLREGVKHSAPSNFTLPKPVAIPPAPGASNSTNQQKK